MFGVHFNSQNFTFTERQPVFFYFNLSEPCYELVIFKLRSNTSTSLLHNSTHYIPILSWKTGLAGLELPLSTLEDGE